MSRYSNTAEALEAALARHRAGELTEAKALYQWVIDAEPENADALHYMGILSADIGNAADAVRFLNKAIALNPDKAAYHASLGAALDAQGQTEKAIGAYRRAIDLKPDYLQALNNLGLAYLKNEQTDKATDCFRQVAALQPDSFQAHMKLAATLRHLQATDEALDSLKKAVAIDPRSETALTELGSLLSRLGETEQAEETLRRALEVNPDLVEAITSLAIILKESGRLEEGEALFNRAVGLRPESAEVHNNLGNFLRHANKTREAIFSFQQALQLNPDHAEAHNNLGILFKEQGQLQKAAGCFGKALEITPGQYDVAINLGLTYRDIGDTDSALRVFTEAAEWKPGFGRAEWGRINTFPILYESAGEAEERQTQWLSALDELLENLVLESGEAVEEAVRAVSSISNFYLHYQGGNLIDVQKRLGALAERIAAAAYPDLARPLPKRQPGDGNSRIRVGIVSPHFFRHTVCKLFSGWLRGLDRQRFEVTAFYAGTYEDAETHAIAASADTFIGGLETPDKLIYAVGANPQDVLIYTDIGMAPWVTVPAALRLAPVQCCAYGHPVTTGLSSMDYFLSSDAIEAGDADGHYTEKLVRLPGLGIGYEQPDPAAARQPAGLEEAPKGTATYLCPQSLFKLRPEFDEVFPRLCRANPGAVIWFIANPSETVTQRFQQRLGAAFVQQDLKIEEFCYFHARLSQDEFLGLNAAADVILDSIGWSGGNTTLEAVAFDKPVVTLPDARMRGRYTSGVLRLMGVEETIAGTLDDYVEIAARLGKDADWRAEIVSRMAANKAKAYDGKKAIEGLQDFLTKVAVDQE